MIDPMRYQSLRPVLGGGGNRTNNKPKPRLPTKRITFGRSGIFQNYAGAALEQFLYGKGARKPRSFFIQYPQSHAVVAPQRPDTVTRLQRNQWRHGSKTLVGGEGFLRLKTQAGVQRRVQRRRMYHDQMVLQAVKKP